MKRTFGMRASALLIVPAAAFVLTACGGDDDAHHAMPSHSMPGHSMGAGAAVSGHNAQDVMFAQMMIPHHRQAVTMARQAATRAGSPDVKRLAAQIEQAQDPEIKKMTGWLQSWKAPLKAPMDHGMEGMMSDRDMKKLSGLSGKEFDRMFLDMMIKHHQGAVSMARTEQSGGASADAKTLAGSIITGQTAEIATMRDLLKK